MDIIKPIITTITPIASALVDKITPSVIKDVYSMLNDYKKNASSNTSKRIVNTIHDIKFDEHMIPINCYDVLSNTLMNSNLKARIFLVDLLFSLSYIKQCKLEVFGGFPRDLIYDCYNKGELEFNTDLDIRISQVYASTIGSILNRLKPLGITYKKTNHYCDVLTVEFSIPINDEIVLVPVDFVIVKYISTISNNVDFDVNNLIITQKPSDTGSFYWTNNLYNAVNKCYSFDVKHKTINSLIINEMNGFIKLSKQFMSSTNYCLNHTFNAIKNRKASYMFNLISFTDYSSYSIIKIKTYRSNKIMSKGYEILSNDNIKITECIDCAICLNDNDNDNKNSVELTCGHKFHMTCMLDLCRNNKCYKFNSIKCPMCRSMTSLVTIQNITTNTLDSDCNDVVQIFLNYKSATSNTNLPVNTRNSGSNTGRDFNLINGGYI